ncbi:hypothetical protein BCR44DRAFT_33958 [Catenaria anguillulae PL171]|uniref:Uncharacterized protein n=1 Tax=Catenaria anguillulae PL171 TaxID=765915 RepID=A0A1Y2HW42_9FUNG|nr:hypothetical protein BCR44DRAFT_33958 [Catenaria anguillulae PL171]
MCIEDIDNQMGNPPSGVLSVLKYWSTTTLGDYLRTAARDVNHVRRYAPRTEVCDQSKCTYKYMNQWYMWLNQVADEYLAGIRGEQRAAMGMMDGAKEVALEFEQEVVARCEAGNKPWDRKVGGLGTGKLEAGASVPKKIEAAPAAGNAAKVMTAGPSMVAMVALVASLAVV